MTPRDDDGSAAGEEDPGAALDAIGVPATGHVVQPRPDTVPQPADAPPAPPDESPTPIPPEIHEPPEPADESPPGVAAALHGHRP